MRVVNEPTRGDAVLDPVLKHGAELAENEKAGGSLVYRDYKSVAFKVLREVSKANSRITALNLRGAGGQEYKCIVQIELRRKNFRKWQIQKSIKSILLFVVSENTMIINCILTIIWKTGFIIFTKHLTILALFLVLFTYSENKTLGDHCIISESHEGWMQLQADTKKLQ